MAVIYSVFGWTANYIPSNGYSGSYDVNSSLYYRPTDLAVVIPQGAKVTLKSGAMVSITGTLIVRGQLVVEEGAVLTVSDNMRMSSYYNSSFTLNGSLTAKNIDYETNKSPKNVTVVLNKDVNLSGSMTVNTNTTLTISSGTRVNVAGNLTNSGTINLNGRLVVGTLMDSPDGKTIIKSNGTITNYGTINIETTPTALAKAQSDNPSLLENSVYYAAITCEDFVNGNSSKMSVNQFNGEVNMYDGSLIVQNDADLYYCSKILFKRGTSYVDVWNNLTQIDKTYEVEGEEAIVKLDGTGAKAVVNVREMYDDWTTLDNARKTHDWDLDNNQFTIDPNLTLSVGSYNSRLTEYLDENTHIYYWGYQERKSITKDVYSTDYDYMDDEIDDNTREIERLTDLLLQYTGPEGSAYKDMIEQYGDTDGPSGGKAMAKKMRDQLQADIDKLQADNVTLGLIEAFGEGTLTDAQIKTLNNWFYNSGYGRDFINRDWYIKSNKKYYSYYEYFYSQFKNDPTLKNNHLKLYHYILAYMDSEGYDKMYYDERHDALSVMLPIELSYFNVTQEGSFVVFEWTTETETNNDFFTVEYSIDGVQYNALTNVEGAGTSTEKLLYSAEAEADMFDGIVYFRLKQTDFNGESTYSDVKAIDIQGKNADFVVYPNPATNEVTIEGGEYAKVYFVDMQSKTYSAEQIGENQYSVENLPNGLNFVVIETARGPILKKIMIVRECAFEK